MNTLILLIGTFLPMLAASVFYVSDRVSPKITRASPVTSEVSQPPEPSTESLSTVDSADGGLGASGSTGR